MAHYAENKAFEGTTQTNEANKEIAVGQNATNIELQRMANEANLRLAKQQNDWNVEQWNKQNEYNKPVNQVQRLLEAGINPALVGGVGDAGNSNDLVQSADLAKQQAAHVDARPDLQNPYGADWQNARIGRQQQISNSLSVLGDLMQKRASIAESKQRIAESESRVRLAQGINPYQQALLDAQRKETMGRLRNTDAQTYRAMQLLTGELKEQNMNLARGESQLQNDVVNRNLVKAQIGRIQYLAPAEFKQMMSAAYSATQSGNWDKFRTEFTKKHGYPPENNDWLNRLMFDAMENPEATQERIGNIMNSIKGSFKTIGDAIGNDSTLTKTLLGDGDEPGLYDFLLGMPFSGATRSMMNPSK